jgi:hypothetical protein
MKKPTSKDVLCSFGLSQGLMVGNWRRIYDPGTGYTFYDGYTNLVLGGILLHLILALCVYLILQLPAKILKFVAVLCLPIYFIMLEDCRTGFGIRLQHIPAFAVFIVVGVIILKLKKMSVLSIIHSSIQVFGVMGLVCIVGSVSLFRNEPSKKRTLLGNVRAVKEKIIVAIFDELDPVHALESWPQSLTENQFQVFFRSSLAFSNCAQPGNATKLSIPAFTIGRHVDDATEYSKTDIKLTTGSTTRSWNQSPNILLDNGPMYPVSVLGWYHPYDRILAVPSKQYLIKSNNFSSMFWLLVNYTYSHTLGLAKIDLLPPKLAEENAIHHRKINKSYRSDLIPWIRNHTGLIMLHIPAPHSPYSLVESKIDRNGLKVESYYRNVQYAGVLLNEIENELINSTSQYTLIVTSDHNLREELNGVKPCGRIPLMLKSSEGYKPQVVTNPVYGENLYFVMQSLIKNKKLSSQEIITTMSRSRP